jgi:hypothetical protein
MADDPLAGYVPSSPGTDPLAGYVPSSPAPADGAVPSIFNRPEGQGVGDYLWQLTAKEFQGAPQAAADYARVASNTFGLGDRLLAGAKTNLPMMYPSLFGQDASSVQSGGVSDPATLDQRTQAALLAERAQTEAAQSRLGPGGSAIANAVGYGPFGELGVGRALGGKLLGTAAEGALSGGLAAEGHGDDPVMGALLGGGTGVVARGVTNFVNPLLRRAVDPVGRATGLLSDPAAVTASTSAAEKAAYAPAHNIMFNPDDVDPAYRSAIANLDKDQLSNISPGFRTLIKQQRGFNSNGTPTSASNIDGFQRALDQTATTNADKVLAGKITDNLDDVLQNAQPTSAATVGGQVIPHAPGDAADVLANAKLAHQQAANAADLQGMSQNLTDFQTNPGGQVKSIVQKFYPSPSNAGYAPQRNALLDVYRASGGGGQTAYNLMHMIDPILGYAGATVAGGPGAIAGEIAGHALKPTIGGMLGGFNRAMIQRRLADAYPALTGSSTSFSPDVGEALKSLLFGSEAGAGY